jgi:hypothetical protein
LQKYPLVVLGFPTVVWLVWLAITFTNAFAITGWAVFVFNRGLFFFVPSGSFSLALNAHVFTRLCVPTGRVGCFPSVITR